MVAKQKPKSGALAFLNKMDAPGKKIVALPIDDIRPDPNQPRTTFHAIDGEVDPMSETALNELAQDIEVNLLQQPIKVRPAPDGKGYMLVYGERRWRATRINRDKGAPNSDTIDAIIDENLTDEQLRLVQLSENLQREDLSDLQTAHYLDRVLKEFPHLQKQELGKIMNKNSQYVSRILALLDPKWAEVVNSGMITYASLLEQFRALPEEKRDELTKQAKEEGRTITSGDIKKARESTKAAKAGSAAANAGAGGALNPSVISQVSEITASQTPADETYVYNPSDSKPLPERRSLHLVDHGGDAVIPAGAAALSPDLLKKREVRLTLAQIEKVLAKASPKNKAHVFTSVIPVEDIKAMLQELGGDVPEDESLLPIELTKRLNAL